MSRTQSLIVIITLFALVGNLAFVTYAIMQPPVTPPPAIEWLGDTYKPVAGCPGDEMRYSMKLRIDGQAILFVATAYLRGGSDGDTIQGDSIGNLFVTVIPDERTIVDEDASWIMPDFPPGDYVRVVAAGTFSEPSAPAIRLQPFTIVEGCD